MSYKQPNPKIFDYFFKSSEFFKKNFNFHSGKGIIQLDVKKLFTSKDCLEIYNKFSSNLNWIVRDSQVLKVKKKQILISKRLIKLMNNIIDLLQKNIPEKNHIHLNLETLRIARSDGTQHQVGSRWHQDHEAYFTVIINLTDENNPNFSTKYFELCSKEKYKLDKLGNPIIKKKWKQNYIKPFHLGIMNSGLRHFLFPYDKCRPIVHHAPKLSSKRLAIFATFSISGIEQGMDLKDIYLPLCINKKSKDKKLRKLRNFWREILGINKSILSKDLLRISKTKFGLYNLNSLKVDLNNFKKMTKKSSNQPRIINFGLKQFFEEKFIKNKIAPKATYIGALSRSLNFFSSIGDYVINHLSKDKSLNLNKTDCSIYGNNNYDLFIQLNQPKKAFQLLDIDEIQKNIFSYILILYSKPKNLIINKKFYEKFDTKMPYQRDKYFSNVMKLKNINNVTQIFTSFDLKKSKNFRNSLMLLYSFEHIFAQGEKKIIIKKNKEYFLINKKNCNKFMNIKIKSKKKKIIDKVPFFLPRVGVHRKLPDLNSGSKIFKSSKGILAI